MADEAGLLVPGGGGLHGSGYSAGLGLAKNSGLGALHHGGVFRCDGLLSEVAGDVENVAVFDGVLTLLVLGAPWLFLAHFSQSFVVIT